MSESILKGTYDLHVSANKAAKEPSLEEAFERSALQKLGGSIAFIKKAGSFIWKGPAKDQK
jgi:hypothetical protein